ncbi:helix-turn-helix domain-containing protein [Enterococcus termitis]|uniref:HTH cro/C1-type domain-containing protein n=1 Tax=Enterococcus termitis TaxID=332950 RepID=A0A1E5GY94_9ENTE|nr:helix-turn-helix domain-containing protein [Enterococcus termitis]OEG17636.1 hypothetical protein BCR25_18165 [Enterococcus termitis]OJG96382.1 hypothetical protein RV18_GL002561 [Enterococcus termitis]
MLEIGKKIKELRQSKKMTQKALADILNVTPQAVSKWERNESYPDIEMLVKLSDYFNVSTDELLGTKSQSVFDSLYSKLKGRTQMSKVQNHSPKERSNREEQQKKIIIFDMAFSFISDKGLMQTQVLSHKLSLLMKQQEQAINIDVYNSKLIDRYGDQADVILLTPTFSYAKAELEKKFPETPVLAISKKQYGMLDVEKLYDEIIGVLGSVGS